MKGFMRYDGVLDENWSITMKYKMSLNGSIYASFITDDQQRTYIFYIGYSNYIRTTMYLLYTMFIYIIYYLLYIYY